MFAAVGKSAPSGFFCQPFGFTSCYTWAMDAQELKNALGANTTELARLCGVHRMTMQKWLTGERPPSAAVVRLFGLLVWLDDQGLLEKAVRDLEDAGGLGAMNQPERE